MAGENSRYPVFLSKPERPDPELAEGAGSEGASKDPENAFAAMPHQGVRPKLRPFLPPMSSN
jgi:hypothetical protein